MPYLHTFDFFCCRMEKIRMQVPVCNKSDPTRINLNNRKLCPLPTYLPTYLPTKATPSYSFHDVLYCHTFLISHVQRDITFVYLAPSQLILNRVRMSEFARCQLNQRLESLEPILVFTPLAIDQGCLHRRCCTKVSCHE